MPSCRRVILTRKVVRMTKYGPVAAILDSWPDFVARLEFATLDGVEEGFCSAPPWRDMVPSVGRPRPISDFCFRVPFDVLGRSRWPSSVVSWCSEHFLKFMIGSIFVRMNNEQIIYIFNKHVRAKEQHRDLTTMLHSQMGQVERVSILSTNRLTWTLVGSFHCTHILHLHSMEVCLDLPGWHFRSNLLDTLLPENLRHQFCRTVFRIGILLNSKSYASIRFAGGNLNIKT